MPWKQSTHFSIAYQDNYMSNIWRTVWQNKWNWKWQKQTIRTTALTYRLLVAFAWKMWKLTPSIGRRVQLQPISEARLAIMHPNNPRTQPHTKLRTVFVYGKRQPTCIHQTMYWIMNEYLYVYIFVSNYYYSHTYLLHGAESFLRS